MPQPRNYDPDAELPRRQRASELVAAELPERPAVLDPILSSNSLALLYGPRGLGKSFLALGIAWAAASGGSFLGWRASRPYRVLYVDGEMAAGDMKRRLLLLGAAPPTLEIMQADGHAGSLPDLGYLEGQCRLMMSWGHPELVVLDNLSSLAGFTGGDHDCWGDLQRFLIRPRRFGRAMLLVHHANKKGGQRGTNRREDVLDLVMALRRPADYAPRQGARFEIHFEKARGLYGEAAQPIEARLETDIQGVARWHWRPAQESDLDRVVALLREGLTPYRAARELGLSQATTYRLRQRAAERGLLQPANRRR
jgi:DNA-binding CsgD family transcriptional regulator